MFDFSKVGQLGAGAPAGKFSIILNHLISIAERNRQTGERVEQKKKLVEENFSSSAPATTLAKSFLVYTR